MKVRRVDRLLRVCLSTLDDSPNHFSADVADLAFKVADAGLTGVGTNDLSYAVIGEGDIVLGQTGRFALFFSASTASRISTFSISV